MLARLILLTGFLVFVCIAPAEAKTIHAKHHVQIHKLHKHKISRHRKPLRHLVHIAGRPYAWCGWYMAQRLGITGKLARNLWVARNWARYGSPAHGPSPGVIVVWPHHVGQVTGVPGPGRIIVLSGNDGHAVRERERSTRGVIAWRYVGSRFALN